MVTQGADAVEQEAVEERVRSSSRPGRGSPRQNVVNIAWVGSDDDPALAQLARTVDLCARGVGLFLSKPIPVGSRVTVELLIDGRIRLGARGRIAHASVTSDDGSIRVGVEFDDAPRLLDGDPAAPWSK